MALALHPAMPLDTLVLGMTARTWTNTLPARRQIIGFFTPTLIVCGCFVISVVVVSLSGIGVQPTTDFLSLDPPTVRLTEIVSGMTIPHSSQTPIDVVSLQLQALAHDDLAYGSMQCMLFASPKNRAATGPLLDFGEMIHSPPYDILREPDHLLIGEPEYRGKQARVLVTVLRNAEMRAFWWELSRYAIVSHPGTDHLDLEIPAAEKPELCWMTDAVYLTDNLLEDEKEL